MTSYRPGDIILVPFPFTDLSSTKKRPALVVSPPEYNAQGDVVIAFITSNMSGPARFGDYAVQDWKAAGLPLPSKLRMKFATVSREIIIKSIGQLSAVEKSKVQAAIMEFFMSFSG
jgi:mRNA interferase MazF